MQLPLSAYVYGELFVFASAISLTSPDLKFWQGRKVRGLGSSFHEAADRHSHRHRHGHAHAHGHGGGHTKEKKVSIRGGATTSFVTYLDFDQKQTAKSKALGGGLETTVEGVLPGVHR